MSILENLKRINGDASERRELSNDDLKASVEEKKRYVIVSTKDLSKEDKDIFESYGKLIIYDERYVNLKYDDLEFDYLYVDIRDKVSRYNLATQNIDNFHIVIYCAFWEKIEEFIEQLQKKTNDQVNVITSIPAKCINKDHFDKALLVGKLSSPSFLKSAWKYAVKCFGK